MNRWRILARECYCALMNFRAQVLRYTVPPDLQYIAALDTIDQLIREHDAALRDEEETP